MLRFSHFFCRNRPTAVKTGAPRVKRTRPRTPPSTNHTSEPAQQAALTFGNAVTTIPTTSQQTQTNQEGKQPQILILKTTLATPTSETADPTAAGPMWAQGEGGWASRDASAGGQASNSDSNHAGPQMNGSPTVSSNLHR